MNIQSEKLELISWLIQLQDMSLLEELQAFRKKAEQEAAIQPMTVEELVARSRASDEDIAAGRVYDADEVFNELLG
ncbi:MAG: hypothetical protein AAGJ93_02310 [Bacteroidota bacterium]